MKSRKVSIGIMNINMYFRSEPPILNYILLRT